ncbi:MAG TPA: serine protease [Gemmatimonadales bacterium]|jgi:serine protease Do|nr:serine protease [Gemmatimonadales bacterium]
MTGPAFSAGVRGVMDSVVELIIAGTVGSGFVWGPDVVVTSAHVVQQGPVMVRLPNGQERSARVRLADRDRDIALLDVPSLGLPAVRSGDPTALRIGQTLFAVGHPLGVRYAMSSGILHAVGPLPDGYPLPPHARRLTWVQADLRLAPGNSGGPIADARGRVVGVSTMIAAGLALAVPITAVDALLRSRAA